MRLYQKLREETPDGFRLLADSAFPGGSSVNGSAKILRVPKENSREYDRRQRQWYDAITRQRQAVEWGMRSIQSAFQRLRIPLPSDHEQRRKILNVIFRLHNFRVSEVNVSQIRSVYYDPYIERNDDNQ